MTSDRMEPLINPPRCGTCDQPAVVGVRAGWGDRYGWCWHCANHLADAEAEINTLHMNHTLWGADAE
jgi:hypothetical protein